MWGMIAIAFLLGLACGVGIQDEVNRRHGLKV